MGPFAGAYRQEKRRKELNRLKKQEEKRRKRFEKSASSELTKQETAIPDRRQGEAPGNREADQGGLGVEA